MKTESFDSFIFSVSFLQMDVKEFISFIATSRASSISRL
jgi:hypothetical protein